MMSGLLAIATSTVNVNHGINKNENAPVSDSYYLIKLSNIPGGSGFYQQFIKIQDPGNFGINQNGSNIEFFATNNTQLYAWIQSLNSSKMTVFVKNYNDSNTILLKVLPYNSNVLSSTGYVGEAPQLSSIYGEYDNGKYVFPFYCDFKGNNLNTTVFVNNSANSDGKLVIDNGFKYTPNTGNNNNYPFMYSKKIFSYVTLQAYGNIPRPVETSTYDFYGYGFSSINDINTNLEGIGRFCSLTDYNTFNHAGISYPINETLNYGNYIWSLTVGSSVVSGTQYNASGQGNYVSANTIIHPDPLVFFDQDNSGNSINFTWVRALTYLPSGMPSYTLYNSQAHYFSFIEKGLPYGVQWSVTVFGSKYYSSGNDISMWLPGNNYHYIIYTPDYARYISYNQYGTVNSGMSNSIEIKFLEINYAVYFNGTGKYNIIINGKNYSVSGNIKLCEPYGNYNYTLYYNGKYLSGNFTVNGNNVFINTGIKNVAGNLSINQTSNNLNEHNKYELSNYIFYGVISGTSLIAISIIFLMLRRK